jgi:hypothetical protein
VPPSEYYTAVMTKFIVILRLFRVKNANILIWSQRALLRQRIHAIREVRVTDTKSRKKVKDKVTTTCDRRYNDERTNYKGRQGESCATKVSL